MVNAIYGFLIRSFLTRVIGLGATALLLLTIAALAEGRPPDFESEITRALPFSACMAATWSIGIWRAEGTHIVLGNMGRSPAMAVLIITALSTPTFFLSMMNSPEPERGLMSIKRDEVSIRTPLQQTTIQWRNGRAQKITGTRVDETKSLRPPIGSSQQQERRPAARPLLSVLILFSILWRLGFRREDSGLFETMGWGIIAYACGPLFSIVFA